MDPVCPGGLNEAVFFLQLLRDMAAGTEDELRPVQKTLTDGSIAHLIHALCGQGEITRTHLPHGMEGQDKVGYDERWDYSTYERAKAAFEKWDGSAAVNDGEPEDWIRHIPSFRRREDGDPSREEVRR